MNVFDLLVFILSLFFIFFESVILKFINSSMILPDIILVILTYYSLKTDSIKGQLFGFVLGLIKDFLSSSAIGYYGIIYLTIGFVASKFNSKNSNENYFFLIIITFLMFFIKGIFIALYLAIVKDISFIVQFTSSKFMLEIGLSLAISTLIFLFLSYLSSMSSDKFNNKYEGI